MTHVNNRAESGRGNKAKMKEKRKEEVEEETMNCELVPVRLDPVKSVALDRVKSVAVVKYAAVETPALYTRLSCNTNLNLPPSNWLSNSIQTYGVRPTMYLRSCFSSFTVANKFLDSVGQVDVIADAENIKTLLKIPYSRGSISMMVHRIENTLLIDEFDLHRYLLREAETQWDWFRKFFFKHIMKPVGKKDILLHHKDNSRYALQQKSLASKFLYHSVVVADDDMSYVKKEEVDEAQPFSPSVPIPLPYKKDNPALPDPKINEGIPESSADHNFSRKVLWTFENIQMLLGTDMPIFGGGTHPCISLRLRDMTKPINVLTGMDYWLDNLMCNVPEVVMCYHLNGIVQRYELIKTEDLPHLENSKFSPKVIRDIAQNILSFLKTNATKAGHTYWLFKGRDDDVVKLYDLTSLCTDVMEEKGQTPFTVPVAMLLYRVARNMKSSPDARQHAATMRVLLQNCLALLDPEKYPDIVTSAHYMMSDLYLPAETNPKCPHLILSDEEPETKQGGKERKEKEEAKRDDCSVKSLSLSDLREIQMDDLEYIPPPPPPIGNDIKGRCFDSIKHVMEALESLKHFKEAETKDESETANADKTSNEDNTTNTDNTANTNNSANSSNGADANDTANTDNTNNLANENNKAGKNPANTNDTANSNNTVDADNAADAARPSNISTQEPKRKNKKKKGKQAEEDKSLLPKTLADVVKISQKPKPFKWKVHLKTLLYEKAYLVHATLVERAYIDREFGVWLCNMRIILKIRKVLRRINPEIYTEGVENFFLGPAGDALFMIVQDTAALEVHNKEYLRETAFCRVIQAEMELLGITALDENEILFPPSLMSIEDLLISSYNCYKRAIAFQKRQPELSYLQKRLGNILNELGVYYMNLAAGKYENPEDKDPEKYAVFKGLCLKSYTFLDEGLNAFDEIRDKVNLALLNSNLGRLMRLRVHYMSLNKGDNIDTGKVLNAQERCLYNKAISSYQMALQILGERKYYTSVWDSVNWELCTTFYTLGSLLQDNMAFAQEEAEREVTEILHKSLKYCEIDNPGPKQVAYQFRSAMIHHRLGSLCHKSYRSNFEDESRRKKIFQLCKLHYEKAVNVFLGLHVPGEYLRVQLERLSLAEYQFENINNANGKIKHLESAVEMLVEAKPMFKVMMNGEEKTYEMLEEMVTEEGETRRPLTLASERCEKETVIHLLNAYEQKLHFVLLTLTKLTLGKTDMRKEPNGETYKKLYGITLKKNVKERTAREIAKWFYNVMSEITKVLKLNR